MTHKGTWVQRRTRYSAPGETAWLLALKRERRWSDVSWSSREVGKFPHGALSVISIPLEASWAALDAADHEGAEPATGEVQPFSFFLAPQAPALTSVRLAILACATWRSQRCGRAVALATPAASLGRFDWPGSGARPLQRPQARPGVRLILWPWPPAPSTLPPGAYRETIRVEGWREWVARQVPDGCQEREYQKTLPTILDHARHFDPGRNVERRHACGLDRKAPLGDRHRIEHGIARG